MKLIYMISALVLFAFVSLLAYGLYTQCSDLAPEIYRQCKTLSSREVLVWLLVFCLAAICCCRS